MTRRPRMGTTRATGFAGGVDRGGKRTVAFAGGFCQLAFVIAILNGLLPRPLLLGLAPR